MKSAAIVLTLLVIVFVTHLEVFAQNTVLNPQELTPLEQQIQELEFRLDGGLSASAPDPVLVANLKEQLSVLYAQREVRGERNPLDQGSDTCPGTPLFGLPVVVTGTTSGYANNHAPYSPCGTTGAADVVYSFVPSHTLSYTITTEGSSYDTYLYIIGGGPCPGTTQVGCDDDSGPGTTSLITVTLNGGTPYYIYVDGWQSNEGNYVLTIRDNCEVTCQPGDLIECPEVRQTGHELVDCNGACYNPIPTWQDIFPFQTVCGRLFTYTDGSGQSNRDQDIYRFTLTEPCSLRISLQTEVSARVFVLSDNCPWSLLYEAPLWQYPCSTTTNITQCFQPGTYNLWIASANFDGINDYRDYRLSLEFLPCSGCVIEHSMVAPGMTSGLTCFDSTYCDRTGNPSDVVAVTIPYRGSWNFTLCGGSGPWDSYLFLSDRCCGTYLASGDDICGSEGVTAEISCTNLDAGTYYLTVTGYAPFGCGYYELTVSECSGSCCYGDFSNPSCAQTTLTECETLAGLFTAQEPCSTGACPVRRGCQSSSIFAQFPPLPNEPWDFWTSHVDHNEIRCDDYDVSEPIGSIRFWGFPLVCGGAPENFRIEFYDNVNSQVYNVSVLGTQYPEYDYSIPGFVLTEYTAVINPPCTILSGTVEVAKVGNVECAWNWLTTPYGNNAGPCGGWDFSFCLAAPVPCEAVDSLTIQHLFDDLYSLDWWQPQAGIVNFYATNDPNAVYPVGYSNQGTLPFGAGHQSMNIISAVDFASIILVVNCTPVANAPQNEPLRFRLE